MILDQKYTYFFGAILFLLIWLVLYIRRKDVRHEMLIVSVFVALLGIVAEYLILTGFTIAPLYEYWQGYRLRKIFKD